MCRVDVRTQVGRRQVSWTLSDVLVIPDAPYNLFSGTAAMAKGIDIEGRSSSKTILLRKAGEVIGVATPENGQAVLRTVWQMPEKGMSHANRVGGSKKVPALALCYDKAELWHRRLGHLSYDTMLKMVRHGTVTGMDVTESQVRAKLKSTCKICMEAKHAADSHPESRSRATEPLQRVHSDLMGPMRPMSKGGNEYVLTIVDDYSGYAEITPLKHKSEATEAIKKVLLGWERQTGKKVKIVRTDRGTEYAALDKWCASQGILRERSVVCTPAQNGRAERFHRTITQKARAMLLHAGFAKRFWADTFMTATVVYNLSPRLKQSATPHELFWGHRPDLSHVKTFGRRVFCQRLPQERTKLSSWSEEGQFVGYERVRRAGVCCYQTAKWSFGTMSSLLKTAQQEWA
jgi:transposase InsO family protein